MVSIGEQIRNFGHGKGLPLRKVAAELDMDQSILSKIERGERKAFQRTDYQNSSDFWCG